MIAPTTFTVTCASDWQNACSEYTDGIPATGVVIVHTPSALKYVEDNFDWAVDRTLIEIAHEPSATDFSLLDRMTSAPSLVVGVGGGKALDAAKVVAQFRQSFSTAHQLIEMLISSRKIESPRTNRLILAPSLASSGSEASQAAIVSVGDRKLGLRSPSLLPDAVAYDSRLWANLPEAVATHYAFDVFAHLVETTISLRRSEQTKIYAAEGFARLGRWYFRGDASFAHYQDAMDAAFCAGICLATSSTCLPHRIQYVIGPATQTSHVEGISYLWENWFPLLEISCPDRLQEAEQILSPECFGKKSLHEVFTMIHQRSNTVERIHRFDSLRASADLLAAKVSGDLAADPTYAGIQTIIKLI